LQHGSDHLLFRLLI